MSSSYVRTFYHEIRANPLSRPDTIQNALNKFVSGGKVTMGTFEYYATMILGDPPERAHYDNAILGLPTIKSDKNCQADYEPMRAYIDAYKSRKGLGDLYVVPPPRSPLLDEQNPELGTRDSTELVLVSDDEQPEKGNNPAQLDPSVDPLQYNPEDAAQ